jgi:hypothetical protein
MEELGDEKLEYCYDKSTNIDDHKYDEIGRSYEFREQKIFCESEKKNYPNIVFLGFYLLLKEIFI